MERVYTEGVSLNETSVNCAVGDKMTLVATVKPNNATNKRIEWSSDNEEVATVDQEGVVTAIKEGTVGITVKTKDGGYQAQCQFTIHVHKWSDWKQTIEPTYETDGQEERECSICHKKENRFVPKKDKAESEVIITNKLGKPYDGTTVAEPEVTKAGSSGLVIFTWYVKQGNTWNEISGAPKNVGSYKVKATLLEDQNYNGSFAEQEFVITKGMPPEINEPDNLSSVQNAKLSTVQLPDGWTWMNSEQTVMVNNNGYEAQISVDDANYDYSHVDGYDETRHAVIRILQISVKKNNTWIVKPGITDWTYGQTASKPYGEAAYGTVEFTYSNSENGVFTEDVPKTAGTWYMQAFVKASDKYVELKAIVKFTIRKPDSNYPPITTPDPIPDNYPDGSMVKPDGTIEIPDGTQIKPDGTIVLPGKEIGVNEDDIYVEKGEGQENPKYDPEDGTVIIREGNQVIYPEGLKFTPPEDSVINQEGILMTPDGTKITPDGITHRPDGAEVAYDGSILKVATPEIQSVEIRGNVGTVILEGKAFGAEGYDYVISDNLDCIIDKDYQDVNKDREETETDFKYIQKGTYYAYCHAWFKDENGKKVFGEWSEGYRFEVIDTTPEAPVIQSIKKKGDGSITITTVKGGPSIGYDIIFGTKVKEVNGELRPVDYGNYVKKNQRSKTLTFRHLKKGTYYIAAHAYNKGEKGQKIFSPWSNIRKLVIK